MAGETAVAVAVSLNLVNPATYAETLLGFVPTSESASDDTVGGVVAIVGSAMLPLNEPVPADVPERSRVPLMLAVFVPLAAWAIVTVVSLTT